MENRKVIFFVPKFMGYEKSIEDTLSQNFEHSVVFDQRSVTTAVGKALSKKVPVLLKNKNIKYYKEKLDSVNFHPTDVVIIQGDMIENESVLYMRKKWPNVRIRLYLWDNLKNLKGVRGKLAWFDSVKTFDPGDSEIFETIKFRPLFYVQDYKRQTMDNVQSNYDISFIGTAHSDRNKILDTIFNSFDDVRKFDFRYLPVKWLFYFYKITNPSYKAAKPSDFQYKTIHKDKIRHILERSKVVIDINHPDQKGLTIRTFELLAMKKKMITTNTEIKKYDFFNPNNIYVVKRDEKIEIPNEFFQTDYQVVDDSIVEKYSIERWLFEVLEMQNEG